MLAIHRYPGNNRREAGSSEVTLHRGRLRSEAGFTIVEMVFAVLIIGVLTVIYFTMINTYKDGRMSEQAAKVLVQAARVQEEFNAKEAHYFDAEVTGNGGDAYLTLPSGKKTSVRVPPHVVLSLRAVGKERRSFVGHSFYTGSKVLHRYDSSEGRITTVKRLQEEAG
ncbi:type II secretion system protein [Thermodesulfobacteriota bacterium]